MINFYDIDDANTQKLLTKVYNQALKNLSLPDDFLVEVSIVSEDKIKEANCNTRDVDEITDVLSFPNLDFIFPYSFNEYKFDVDYDCNKIMLGDIIICKERMIEQAKEYGHSETRELSYLFLHGILHLFGFDHMIEEDKVVMRKREEEVLNALGINRE
ncbi:MAG: rRNA maturation RNase YbeY [Clostridia bacterium]